MSKTIQCLTCGGTYQPEQTGGYRYFHTCAPVFDSDKKAFVERAGRRDENLKLAADGTSTGIKAAGNGTITVEE